MPITTLHYTHLFYEICKARGIKVLMIRSSSFVTKYIISDTRSSIENTQSTDKFHFNSLAEIQNYLKKYDSEKKNDLELENWLSSKTDYLRAILKFLFSSNTNVKTHYTYYGRTKFAVLKETMSIMMQKRRRQSFINKNLIKSVLSGKYSVKELSVYPGTLILFYGRNYLHRVTPVTSNKSRILVTLNYNLEKNIKLSENARLTFFGRLK